VERAILTKTKRRELKRECREGPEAKKAFEETMKNLFRAPKVDSKKSRKGKDLAAFL
jgi:hypothetical protein